LASEENITNVWKQLVTKFLMPLFPSIYFEEDSKFNTPDVNAIKDLILAIDELNVDEKFIDSFSTTCGDIHEAFRAYGGRSSGARELGQYFTPRHLIHLMFHGVGLDCLLDNNKSSTIYDPCMGTGGFLTRLFKMASIPSSNIYGCETEQDTIKFGEMSMLLTTGDVDNHIKKCNSISENKFISQGKTFNAIVTNPPFGTSMKYEQLMKTYEKCFPDSKIKFTEVYPLKMNNGAGLFIQHCVHMLADGGVCAIVLPDGELFEGNSPWSKKLRKWLSENVNIRIILKVPSGTFEHAGVKTNVVVFTKDGPTQNIRFIETTKECDTVKEMFTISSQELKTSGYSLDVGEYLVEETDNYNVPMVTLGEVCDIQNGYAFKSNDYKSEGNPIITIKNITNCGKIRIDKVNYVNYNIKYNKFIINQNDILIALTGATIGKIGIFKENTNNYYLNQRVGRFTIKDNINKEYFYYWLLLSDFKDKIILNSASGERGNISTEVIKTKIKIPLPSLEVQQQIVDELSQIETSIETIESRIAQLKREKDQYKKYGRKAEIRELLKDSEEKMLGEVCELNKNSIKNEDNYNEIKYIALSNINEGYVENIKTINFKDKPSRASRKCNIGDVLLGGTRPNLRNHCIITEELYSDNLIVSTAFIVLTPIEVLSKYIYNLIMSDDITNLLVSKCTSDPPAINITNASSIKIPLPSQEVQQQCITLFEEKEKFIQSINDKINSEKVYIEELKQLAKDVISSFC
jgi:restriction endonuclease S subunit